MDKTQTVASESEQIVTPWKVTTKGQFNYDKLLNDFGLKFITDEMKEKIQKITGKPLNHFLTRDIFFAHQDFDKFIDAYIAGKPVYIYTGRGPSSDAMHLGHLLPMMFTAYMQQVFGCWVVMQMSDEEKFYFKSGKLEEFMAYTESNAKDIIACGFDPKKTFVFSSLKYETYTRPIVAQINKLMSVHTTNKIYGFDDSNNIGQVSWPPLQMAPAYCGAFPHLFGDRKDVMCLVVLAVDQTPYFRAARDYAENLGYPKPAMVCGKFLVGLQGVGEKLSSTGEVPAIFLNDSRKDIETKIKKYAFSGGRETLEEHRRLGANLQVDVPYIYLFHFMEDEAELKRIAADYGTGKMLTSEIKKILVDVLEKMLAKHQSDRAAITSELYNFMFTMRVQSNVRDAFRRFHAKYIQADPVFE